MRRVLPILVVAALSGCVHHNYVPGPGATNPNPQMVAGQCKLLAISGIDKPELFVASGSERFVAAEQAGHAIGSAVGKAIQANTIFNACMEANGYVDAPPAQQP